MGVMDSSFLFLPFGNDLLVVGLVARNHGGFLIYALMAAAGATLGVALLDLASRKLGEEGIKKMAGERRFEYLHKKIGQRGAVALAIACLAPPPFPFTAVVGIECALDYPRKKLFPIVFASRAARFLILGFLAIKFGRSILRVANSDAFKWTMAIFIILCVIGSVFSVMKWLRSRGGQASPAKQQPAHR